MKEYTSNQRKKIVLKINKVKNKEILASKYDISIRTYYYWKRQLETCSIIKPKSTKPKTNKNKLKDKKIIKRIIEIRKLYGYGKFKIQKQLELEAIKVGTTAIETVLKENSKKEAIERLRNQLDLTIRNNINLNRNNNNSKDIINDSNNTNNTDEKTRHDNILKLHKEGLSNKEIATQLKCSLTEVDIVIELNNN